MCGEVHAKEKHVKCRTTDANPLLHKQKLQRQIQKPGESCYRRHHGLENFPDTLEVSLMCEFLR